MNNVNFGKNKFCGPAALSAVSGITTDEAEILIKKVTGQRRPVKGVWTSDLCKAFNILGYSTEICGYGNHSDTLFTLIPHLAVGLYLCVVPSHFILLEVDKDNNRFICDNHTRKPLNLSVSARLGQRVSSVIRLVKTC